MTPDTAPAAIITRFSELCQQDERILAGFLSGSYARGAADAYSDLDLGVITRDGDFDDFAAGKLDFIRRLDEPLLLEDFDQPDMVFFILSGGLEGELHFAPQSRFSHIYPGEYKALVDKRGVLQGAVFSGRRAALEQQRENLRRQVCWFWHDLSHFITAMGRGQHWWAYGQIEVLRRTCLNLAHLEVDFSAGLDLDDPYFKLEKFLPIERVEPLRATFCPLEPVAMLAATQVILDFYRSLAHPLAAAHGIAYPSELERLLVERLSQIRL